jgi:RHS repeat-associated protein
LPDVTISVAHHADFGSTHTRADGMFDMAVNGGRVLTIVYTKEGFLPAERQVDAPWQDYAWLPDVRLVTLDPQVTMIDLTAAIPEQVARGSVVTDEDGIRQATLLFTQGTNASMVFADGSSQPLTTLHVRATEYTVGPDGPEAMPAALPPASGYTYAVELSADEAIAAGATRVAFDRPVSFYVENFLNFPVGGGVPSGFYDRQQNVWVPSQNGRIVQIIAMTSGLAEVDVDGDGTADADSKLSPLGITNAELQRLGDLYQVGQSLWRIPITHFTPYDWNWPYGPPAGATSPNQPAAPNPRPESNSCEVSGSICEVQSQILREAVSVVGTPFSLNYSSNVAGRIANRSLNIPLSGDSVPASLAGIQLEVTVAGQRFRRGFSGAPNQTFTFTWDGQDAYGRSVQGTQVATVRIGYVYGAVYLGIGAFESSFGALSSSGTALTVNLARQDVTYWQQYEAQLSKRDVLQEGLGGWLLDVHHTYDPVGRVLHLGDGSRRSTASISDVIMTVAGGGSQPDAEGIRATDATIRAPRGLAADAQGNLFIAEPADDRVRKVSTDGIITTVANLGITSLSTALAIDVHGNLYVPGDLKVITIAPDGTITTVAGTGVSGFSGDGGPATSAQITNPWGLAVDAQGNLFISDQGNHRIRKVSPDGIINTLAGNGQFASNGDGGPAINASFRFPGGLAVDQRGNLYIAENLGHRVRKVSSDGIISTVAGTGVRGFGGDGGPANSAALNIPSALAVDRLGNLYIADSGNFRIRVVDQTGVIYTLAGDGTRDSKGNGVLATAEGIGENVSVAVDSEENVYVTGISQTLKDVVRKISQPLPGFNNLDLAIASEDGTQLYRFDPSGRHLQTLHTLTGATLLSFDYNSAGHLTSVTDVDNNITHIERNSDGDPMAIVAPFGQRTTLGLDANGYVSSIANPANEANNYTYTPDGLMTTFTDPRNGVHRFSYDALARLARDEDPAGGFKTFSRTETEQGFQVTVTTAENRVSTYLVELLPTGSGHRVNTGPDGLSTDHVIRRDGTETITNPDGTIINLTMHPDPRWGMQAPFASALMVTTPGGLRTSLTATRTVTNGSGLSLGILTHAVTFNGNLYTSVFDALTRQITNTTPEGRQTVTVLDAAGRLSAGEIGGVVPFGLTYDAQGRPVSFTLLPGPEAKVETFGYDTQGALVSITGADLRASNYEYDAAGRLTRQVFPDTREITLARNANGNVTRVTPPGQPGHAFEYSAVGLMEMYTPPGGESTGDTLYAYDRDRNRVQIRRPEGTIITAGYNAAGDVEMLTLPNGETQFGYDPGTGQLTTITRHNGDTLSYDFDNTLIMQTTWGGTVSGGVSRTYDNSFRLASESINDAHNVTFRYDRDGLLTQAGSFTINRDAQTGLVIGTALGGVVTATAFDRFADVETATANVNGTDMFAVRYDRDAVSRITRRTETVGGTTDAYDYDYDDAGRLAHVRRNGTFIAGYTYDHNGNRLTATGPGGTALGSYDAQDRLIQYGDTTYVYSPNGTLRSQTTGSQTTIYDYDELGNLVAVSLPDGRRIEYVVDGNNRRVGKRIEGTLIQGFLYGDQLRPRAELDGNSNVVSRFVYATKVNVPVYMEKGGNTYRILSDHLGSPRLVLDVTTGAVVQRMDYDEFGNVVLDTNPGFQPFGFAGGLYDSDTALIRFGSRDYDPRVGRWTSKDALLFGGGSTNLYAYVTNDPINSVDLTGTVNIGLGFLGGVIGAGSNLLSAYINGKSGTDLAVAAGVGFGAGFIGGLIPYPPLSGAVTGGITKAGNIAVGLDCSENPSWDILKEALIGGVLGGIAGAGGRALGEASAPSIAAAEGLGEIGSQLGGVIGGSAATIVQSLPLPGL